MSYGSQIMKKWHEARHGKGPEPENVRLNCLNEETPVSTR